LESRIKRGRRKGPSKSCWGVETRGRLGWSVGTEGTFGELTEEGALTDPWDKNLDLSSVKVVGKLESTTLKSGGFTDMRE